MNHAASTLLAFFGLVAVAPAQLRIEGILGRHVQVGVQIGSERRSCPEPVVVVDGHDRHDRHGGRRDDHRGYDDRRGRDDRRDRHRERGHWEVITEQVHVPGYWREERTPARFGWVYDHCGHRVWAQIEPECVRRVWVPPHCETRTRRVWVGC